MQTIDIIWLRLNSDSTILWTTTKTLYFGIYIPIYATIRKQLTP